jgi:hypothetical protein
MISSKFKEALERTKQVFSKMPARVPGRAYSDEAKRIVIERILLVWKQYSDMRLGQLLENSAPASDINPVEDEKLADYVEQYLIDYPPTKKV